MNNVEFTAACLKSKYRKMVARRVSRGTTFPVKVHELTLRAVAKKLGDEAMVDIFVEAQFAALPSDFCLRCFNRLYPPATIVFGNNCWARYEKYKERGIRDGS